MDINPGSPVPPHQQIAADLRSQISSGVYQPGDKLPSIPALGERYGVAKQTVQRAVDQLRLEGTVLTKPGSGTYVRGSRRRLARLSRGRYGLTRGYHAGLPTRYRRRVYAAGRERPPGDVARAFGVSPESSLVVRRHVIVDGEQPVELGVTWLLPPQPPAGPASTGVDERATEELARTEVLDRPLFQVVEEATGRRYDRVTDEITARLARADEAQLLRVRPDTPLLVLVHTARDTDGDVLEVSHSCWPGPTSTLVDEYRVPGPTPGQHPELASPGPGGELTLA